MVSLARKPLCNSIFLVGFTRYTKTAHASQPLPTNLPPSPGLEAWNRNLSLAPRSPYFLCQRSSFSTRTALSCQCRGMYITIHLASLSPRSCAVSHFFSVIRRTRTQIAHAFCSPREAGRQAASQPASLKDLPAPLTPE